MKNIYASLALLFCLALGARSAIAQTFEAFTEPIHSIDASAADTGRIAEVNVKRGDRVRRGDLLMVLDSQVLDASRQLADRKASSSARIMALEVELELRINRFEQLRGLLGDGAGNPEEVRRARADADVARLNVQAAREDQELARLQLAEIEARIEQRKIRSSLDGIVTEVLKEPGEYVSTLDPHVVTIVRLDQLRATFYVPTETARFLSVEDAARLKMASTRRDATGRIEYIAPLTEADSGRVRVDVLIDNTKGTFRSGVRCTLGLAHPAERDH